MEIKPGGKKLLHLKSHEGKRDFPEEFKSAFRVRMLTSTRIMDPQFAAFVISGHIFI